MSVIDPDDRDANRRREKVAQAQRAYDLRRPRHAPAHAMISDEVIRNRQAEDRAIALQAAEKAVIEAAKNRVRVRRALVALIEAGVRSREVEDAMVGAEQAEAAAVRELERLEKEGQHG